MSNYRKVFIVSFKNADGCTCETMEEAKSFVRDTKRKMGNNFKELGYQGINSEKVLKKYLVDMAEWDH